MGVEVPPVAPVIVVDVPKNRENRGRKANMPLHIRLGWRWWQRWLCELCRSRVGSTCCKCSRKTRAQFLQQDKVLCVKWAQRYGCSEAVGVQGMSHPHPHTGTHLSVRELPAQEQAEEAVCGGVEKLTEEQQTTLLSIITLIFKCGAASESTLPGSDVRAPPSFPILTNLTEAYGAQH